MTFPVEGTRTIPVSPQMEKLLSERWSKPVQVRIENGEFVARKVYAHCDDCGCSASFEPGMDDE